MSHNAVCDTEIPRIESIINKFHTTQYFKHRYLGSKIKYISHPAVFDTEIPRIESIINKYHTTQYFIQKYLG